MARSYRSYRRNKKRTSGFFRFFTYAIGGIILLVFGIYLVFLFDNWRQEKENQEQLTQNFNRILEDLETDISGIARILHKDSLQFDSIITFSDQLQIGPRERNPERLVILYHISFQRHRFSLFNNSYEEIRTLGDMNLVKDPELKRAILNYYETAENILAAINSSQTLFYQTFNPFIHSAGDISGIYNSVLQSDIPLTEFSDLDNFELSDPVYFNRLGILSWRSNSIPMTTMINLLAWRATLIKNEITAFQSMYERATDLKSRIEGVLSGINERQ